MIAVTTVAMMTASGTALTTLGAQGQRQQQQAAMQQQMAQMQQLMQQTDRIATRAQQLSQTFGQQMERSQGQARHQQQIFQRMCDSVNVSAREARQNMDRIQQMLKDPGLAKDPDMQRDMDRLREHVGTMTTSMEEMLNTMDQVQQRLRTRVPQ
jgi:hypothetical protein